jgi:hypothetical protein
MRSAWLGLLVILVACAREVPPEAVALEYARVLYARDLPRAYELISAQDRRWKGEATFVAEGEAFTGNLLEATRYLASFVEAKSVQKTVANDRAEVTLTLKLPNASAPEIAGLFRKWDEAALAAFSASDRDSIRKALDRLRQAGALPVLEGDETFVLVREREGWRVLLNWAAGIRIHFRTRIPEGLPLQAIPEEQDLLVKSGAPFTITVRLSNGSGRGLSMRVAHEIEPKGAASSLVFLQCLLLLPLTLRPKEAKELSSTFMIAGEGPDAAEAFQITFAFRAAE